MKTEEALALIDSCLASEAVRWLEQDYERWTYEPFHTYPDHARCEELGFIDENGLIDTYAELDGTDLSSRSSHSVRPMFQVLTPTPGTSAHWCVECADGELDMDLCMHGPPGDGAGIRLDMATVDEALTFSGGETPWALTEAGEQFMAAATTLTEWQKTWSHFFFTNSARDDR